MTITIDYYKEHIISNGNKIHILIVRIASSSTNTFILFLFSVFLYRHIRSNEANGEKLLNEEANTLKGMFNEVFAINFTQKNLI